jgi:hypothetical protein
MNEDRELREIYQRLKAQDTRSAPSLDSVLAERRRASAWSWAPVGALVVAGLLVAFWNPSPEPEPVSISEWRSPTAFLLEFPGESLLRTVPSLGAPNEEVFRCESCL